MFHNWVCCVVLTSTLFTFIALWPTCFSVTHWFVDNDGKIKQQVMIFSLF